jgi:DNA ligase (NAD+)
MHRFFCLRIRVYRPGQLAAAFFFTALFVGEFPSLLRSATESVSVAGGSVKISERVLFLRSEVRRHDELYHRRATPEITDAEYDELKRELRDLEDRSQEANGELLLHSRVSNIDDRRPGFLPYSHGERMLSLEKAYTEAELRRFHERVARRLGQDPAYVVEPKFDGIAISAIYENGTLIRVLTRGDGTSGDDVMANATRYASVPESLIRRNGQGIPGSIEIRGEVFMSLAEFRRLNRDRETAGESVHASPRNLAAGTLRSNDDDGDSDRRLQAVFYGVGACESAEDTPASHQQLLSQFRTWGLATPEPTRVAESFDALWTAVEELKSSRAAWAFPSDGLVVKVDSREDQRTLGADDHSPHWAIAFKFGAERQTTRLESITLQIGRTGVITPVAELAPIRLGGATIRRASLHNAEEIARRDLRIGDYVVIERGGEVIPAVIGVDLTRRGKTSSPYVFPAVCPGCAEPLVRRNGQVAWRCPNAGCIAQLKRRLRHFASPSCVAIHGLGEATIEKLVDSGQVKSVSDIYRLRREDLSEFGGEASLHALFTAIDRSKSVELWRLICGLGIEGVGQRGAKALAEAFPILSVLAAATADELVQVEGISHEVAKNVIQFFRSVDVRPMIEAREP